VRRKNRKLDNILVIKQGPLGEFVQALAACKIIRDYHYDAKVTLLTTAPYAEMAGQSPYFDAIWQDDHLAGKTGVLKQVRRIRHSRFGRIYDLQNSSRSHLIYRLLWPFRPEWSGIVRGCSHPHKNRKRGKMHTVDRQAEQLAMAGVGLGRGRVGDMAPPPDLSWARDVQRGAARTELTWFGIRKPFALMAPGGAPDASEKRWPAEFYGSLAMRLRRAWLMPVIIGTEMDKEAAFVIQKACPGALSLINRTDFIQIIMLARQAELAIGNNTGPMHLIASSNCPSLVLFSAAGNPDLCAPRGASVTSVTKKKIAGISVGEVWEKLQNLPPRPTSSAEPHERESQAGDAHEEGLEET